ncbi:EamA family transporter [Candidatus Roizmanbacteria bacterium]|nr:EamA family transporter [Candidatus Roizmanbacteria bacterium]
MWFWYALMSALVSAVSVILNKKALKNINASLVSWSLFAFSIPFLIYPAFKDGFPKLNIVFWLSTTVSVILFAYAKTLSLKSLKGSLMSEVVPLAFFSVLFQYVFALIFFSEVLKMIPLLGLVLIILGGYFLKVEEAREDFLRPFKLLFTNKNAFMYLVAMAIMPLTSVFDKTGLINIKPVNQSFLLLWENLLTTVLIGFYMTRKDKQWMTDLKNNFWSLCLNGIVYTILALLYLYGITTGALALVSGVKKLEVFFVLLLAWLLFGDKPKRGVWVGSLMMLIGVILIKVG